MGPSLSQWRHFLRHSVAEDVISDTSAGEGEWKGGRGVNEARERDPCHPFAVLTTSHAVRSSHKQATRDDLKTFTYLYPETVRRDAHLLLGAVSRSSEDQKARRGIPIRNPKPSMLWLWIVDHLAGGVVHKDLSGKTCQEPGVVMPRDPVITSAGTGGRR
jgi:hypothetical protein